MNSQKTAGTVTFDIEALHYNSHGHLIPGLGMVRHSGSQPGARRRAVVVTSFMPARLPASSEKLKAQMYHQVSRLGR